MVAHHELYAIHNYMLFMHDLHTLGVLALNVRILQFTLQAYKPLCSFASVSIAFHERNRRLALTRGHDYRLSIDVAAEYF